MHLTNSQGQRLSYEYRKLNHFYFYLRKHCNFKLCMYVLFIKLLYFFPVLLIHLIRAPCFEFFPLYYYCI